MSLSRWVSRTRGGPRTLWKSLEPLQLGSDTLSLPTEAKMDRDHEGPLIPSPRPQTMLALGSCGPSIAS